MTRLEEEEVWQKQEKLGVGQVIIYTKGVETWLVRVSGERKRQGGREGEGVYCVESTYIVFGRSKEEKNERKKEKNR